VLLREASETGSEETIAAAQRLIKIDRAHEGAWRALMRAHAERGERGIAIQAYERCRAVLSDLMDATPSPETQRLLAELRSGQVITPPVRVFVAEQPPEPHPVPVREGARVGVLPLHAVGGQEESARLAEGVTAEITSDLARFRSLILISTEAVARASEAGDGAALRNRLGIDFVLSGSLQRFGERLRVSVQLRALGEGGHVVWGRHFDKRGSDLLSLQDEVAAAIAAQVEPQILLEESRRTQSIPVERAGAYELVMRALPATVRLEREEFLQAGRLLRQAIEGAPGFAAAHAWLTTWQVLYVGQGWAEDKAEAQEIAATHAERAVALDPQDARSFASAGMVRALLERRPREALALYDRAIAHNPYYAPSYALAALSQLYVGNIDEADRLGAVYKQLSPDDPHAFIYDEVFVEAALLRGDYALAAAAGRAVSEMNPRFASACCAYLAALGHLDEEQEATVIRKRLLALQPRFTVELFLADSPYQRAEDRELFVTGLRRAGVPESALTGT
jgi:TolB-like protein